jgi:putative ABC transport system ATP-binding protein
LNGPSGSGKTTLLNHIGCIDQPTSGDVEVLQMNVLDLTDAERSEIRNKHIGFIFQSFNLVPVLTAYENVEYPLLLRGVSRSERREQCLEMLESVGLREYKDHTPDELSGGQRERVAIARALVTEPEIVLADEPTANLDTETGEQILGIMTQLNKEQSTTFVFSTHDPQVLKFAERICNLRDGVITDEGREANS